MTTRTEAIITALQRGLPLDEVAAAFGVGANYCRRLARERGIDLPPLPKGPRQATKPINAWAESIARELYRWRQVDNDISLRTAADQLGMSVTKLLAAEVGTARLDLVDLDRIELALGYLPPRTLARPQLSCRR